jgi:hypothetical protein
VSFHPARGKPVVAPLKGGSYSAKGVPVGELVVTVEGRGLPAKYASPDTTPLRVRVREGKNTLSFKLSE